MPKATLILLTLGFLAAHPTYAEESLHSEIKFETEEEQQALEQKPEKVEAPPLQEPESSKIRKEREQVEMQTEEEFMQKLEKARLDDEKQRRKELHFLARDLDDEFFEELDQDKAQRSPNQIETQAVVPPEKSDPSHYLTVQGGGLNTSSEDFPSASGAVGLSLGLHMGSDFWFEGGFLYSYIEVDRKFLNDEQIDQFSFLGGPKFSFGLSQHWITPVVGALVGYTRRQFNADENSSNAFDAGFVAGIEFALNQDVKLGVEGRMMANIDYSRDQGVNSQEKELEELSTGHSFQSIEDLNYSVFLVNLKMLF